MGRIICEKHGKQGFREVCEHIHYEYLQNIYREHSEFILGEFYTITVCELCWKNQDLERFQNFAEISFDDFLDLEEEKAKPMEDKWSQVYNSVNRRAWCVQCIAEVCVNSARKKGEPDPFPVFDNTLSANQQDRIDMLEKDLTDHFKIPSSSLSTMSGAFTYPLTLTIYNCVDEKEQNDIVNFVGKFLEQTSLNQAKINFFEEKVWITTKTQLGFHHQRGEEKLLREVNLNC